MKVRITPPPAPGVKAVLVLAQLNPGAGVEAFFTGRCRFSGDVKPSSELVRNGLRFGGGMKGPIDLR